MIPLFAPSLQTEWVGQGPKVEEFEKKLSFLGKNVLTVNSGTSALELAYHILGLGPGDEVITPVFTATATNLPLVRRGVTIVFADVKDNLLMDWDDAISKITPKTKAIINCHLFGLYNKAPTCPVPIIGDACQYLDKTEGELFTAYSFQAVKIITTGDGGVLVCAKDEDYKRAKLLRWYGIDRETGKPNIDVDITEAGYKFHMNDLTARIGLSALNHLSRLREHRFELIGRYKRYFDGDGSPFLIRTPRREKVLNMLYLNGVEAGLVHKRNDLYSVFGGQRQDLPNMNHLEYQYLFLPCHNSMSVNDVDFICKLIARV